MACRAPAPLPRLHPALQHAALYSTHLGRARCGVLCSAVEFFAAFNFGKRAGQRRYYTYSLMPDSLRCSETGAGFFVDFSSKHAMHANAAEEVLYAGEAGRRGLLARGRRQAGQWIPHTPPHTWNAPPLSSPLAPSTWICAALRPSAGEFCIVPDAAAEGGHRLVVDNNSGGLLLLLPRPALLTPRACKQGMPCTASRPSPHRWPLSLLPTPHWAHSSPAGTFAPKAEHLPLMQHLFEANFPGMSVETVAAGDPRLEEYHRQCPSRLSPAAAAAAAAAAATETGAAEGTAEDSVGAEAAKLEKLALEQNGADSAP